MKTRLKKYWKLVALSAFCLVSAYSINILTSKILQIVEPEPVQAQAGESCRVGNNTAAPRGGDQSENSEADYLLVLLQRGGGNAREIATAINQGRNVIVRLGAGEASANYQQEAQDYISALRLIRSMTQKPFIVQAGHNEANCAEYVPLSTEVTFANAITSSGIPNVTYITGQIDFYCGTPPGEPPSSYITQLSGVNGIEGVSLPYYTGSTGSSGESLAALQGAMALAGGKPVYITESGPLNRESRKPTEEEFRDYVNGVNSVLANSQVRTLLLFNAFGINSDANFIFTKPFHKAKCREAFRNECSDVEAVVEACLGDDKDEYYLYPINGVNDFNKDLLKGALQAQGYEAHCTSPAININASVNKLTGYLYDEYAGGALNPDTAYVASTFDQQADLTQAEYPIWRNFDAVALEDRTSFEGYYSHRNLEEEDQIFQDVKSSPIYRLLTPVEQCEQQKKILKATRNMCDKLEDPSACALDEEIENSNLTVLELWDSVQGTSCKDIAELPGDDPTAISMANLPLYIPKAYRLGFLILSAELKGPNENPGTFPFNFLRMTETLRTYEPKHEIRIFTFRIPDYGLNREVGSDIYYDDTLQLTRDTLLTPDEQDRIDEEYEEYISGGGSPGTINCQDPADSEYCRDNPLVEGLVEYVNEHLRNPSECDLSPEEIPAEKANVIFTPTNLPETGGRKHVLPSVGDIVSSLKEKLIGQTAPLDNDPNKPPVEKPWPFRFLSEADAAREPGSGTTKIRSYIIFPQGYQLRTVEETLAGVIYTPEQKEEFFAKFEDSSDEEHLKYFEINNPGLNGVPQEQLTITVTHTKEPWCKYDDEGNYICPDETTKNTITSDQSQSAPRIFGGILGKLTRNIQQALRSFQGLDWEFIKNCDSTEDFLIGGCGSTILPGDVLRKLDEINEQAANCAEAQGDRQITIYDSQRTRELVDQTAYSRGVDPDTLWGVLQIEGAPYLREMRGLGAGETTTIPCADTINSCGAVGPMQLVQGACAQTTCSAYNGVRNIQRNGDLCSIEGALDIAAQKLLNDSRSFEDPYMAAGSYYFGAGNIRKFEPGTQCTQVVDNCAELFPANPDEFCVPAPPVSGCNGLNYCQCAVEGFDGQ